MKIVYSCIPALVHYSLASLIGLLLGFEDLFYKY